MAEEVTTAETDKEPREALAAPEGLGAPLVRSALILALGAFVALMDTTIVGVALRSFTTHFGADWHEVLFANSGSVRVVHDLGNEEELLSLEGLTP